MGPAPTPNILHCLKELCEDDLGWSSFLKPICKIIPDEPAKADKFLNTRQYRRDGHNEL